MCDDGTNQMEAHMHHFREYAGESVMTAKQHPLQCPDCEDGTRWVSRHGGNDPDVWAVECESCNGSGNRRCESVGCGNGWRSQCPDDAVGIGPDNEAFCADHLAECDNDKEDNKEQSLWRTIRDGREPW